MTGSARRSLLAAVAGLVLAGGLAAGCTAPLASVAAPTSTSGGALPATAAAPAPTPGSSAAPVATAEPGVRVALQQITPRVLRPGEDLAVQAGVTNSTDEPLDGVTVLLRLSRVRISDRGDLARWVSDETLYPGDLVATQRMEDPLEPTTSVSVGLDLAAPDVHLFDLPDTSGPRGLTIQVVAQGRVVAQERTFLLWQTTDAQITPSQVAVLLPVTGPAVDPLEPTTARTTLQGLTATGGRLTQLTSVAAADASVSLAVDPALLDLADASADGATDTATLWASQVRNLQSTRSTVSLPWSDPDVAAVAHADASELVDLAVRRAQDADDAPVLLWAPPGGLDASGAAVAAGSGADGVVGAPRRPGETTTDAHRSTTTDEGEATVLVPDTTLSNLLTDSSAAGASTPAAAQQRAVAELAVIAGSGGATRVLVAADRDWTPDVPVTLQLLQALRDNPWATTTGVGELLTGDGVALKPSPTVTSPDELPPAQVRALANARRDVVRFAGVTPDPTALLDGVDEETLAPLSVAWRDGTEARTDVVRGVVDGLHARTTGLSVVPVSDVSVVSATSEVRVTVRNELTVPASVRLHVEPRKACLEADDVPLLELDPSSETAVPVHLRANANCEVVVALRLTDEDGARVGTVESFTAQVRPTIESVGAVLVGILLAIGLVLGIVRTIRRGQSSRRGARVDASVVGSAVEGPAAGAAGVAAVETSAGGGQDEPSGTRP